MLIQAYAYHHDNQAMFSCDVHTQEDWQQVVTAVVPMLQPGMLLTLSGPLGAGKTTFVQYLARALGSRRTPKSPTFALLQSYAVSGKETGITRLLHVDAYRLESEEDMRVLNLDEELQEPGTLIVMEWPERVEAWVKRRTSAVVPMFVDVSGEVRRVRVG